MFLLKTKTSYQNIGNTRGFSLSLTGLLLTLFVITGNSMAADTQALPPKPIVSYDKTQDRLSVNARQASLHEVLAHVATLTGLKIMMDPAAETHITLNLKNKPLEQGLQLITRQQSYVMFYDDKADKKTDSSPLLIGMNVLPKGKQDSSQLKPILEPKGEAFIRKLAANSPYDRPTVFDLAEQRWQARLAKMPKDQREQLEEQAEDKFKGVQERREKHQKRLAEKRKRGDERRAQRQAYLDELRETDPARYELTMQRQEEVKRMAAEDQRKRKLNQ